MLSGIERVLKQAIVEKDHAIASAALVSAMHFYGDNKDVVRRWVAEIQQALNGAASKSITQYHALGLLHIIRMGDRMAVTKLLQQIHKSSSNPLATCLFLRIYAQLLVTDPAAGAQPIDLKPYLRQAGPRGEMVGLEAARIICERAADVYANDVVYAVTALQMFLGASKAVVRFAALRILNELASKCPQRVAPCNPDIEGLITHPNRNIATLAITALLKTGDEGAVDRLVRQIRGYVGEISDEFKVIVVDAVRALCLKFPAKHHGMLDFLGSVLRDEGAFEYKQATVDAVCQIIAAIPESREAALVHLCEFIEDSEYPALTIQILHLLGSQGPATRQPSKLIRYIYNRLVLEDALVRVAAVGALAKIAMAQPGLKPGIVSILKRSLSDPDDDVRDRTVLSLQGMERAPALFTAQEVPDLEALEQRLQEHARSAETLAQPFSLAGVPTLRSADMFAEAKALRFEQLVPTAVASPRLEEPAPALEGSQLPELPEFASFGPLFRSTQAAALTDPGTEYQVLLRKHVFARHLVLEYMVTNTVPGLLLSNVSVAVSFSGSLRQLTALPIATLAHGQTASCFVAFLRATTGVAEAAFENALCFHSQECDPDTGAPLEAGFPDKYPIDGAELGLSDFVKARDVFDWAADWESLGAEQVETFALESLGSLPEAVGAILELYGLAASSGSAAVDQSSPVHTLLMCGTLLDQGRFSVRSRMAMARGSAGVSLELAVRAEQPAAAAVLVSALG